MVSMTVGRVMTTLLSAKPKKLRHAISCLHALQPKFVAPIDFSLEQSLWFLQKYIAEAWEKDDCMDQVLVPMLQNILKIKGSKHGNQTLTLMSWLFLDERLFEAISRDLVRIISRKDDNYVSLGWCILGRSLVDNDDADSNLVTDGIKEKEHAILMKFCSCINLPLSIICNGSHTQDGYELPTRLAVAAADFILSLTIAMAKMDLSSYNMDNKKKLLDNSKNQFPTLLLSAPGEREAKTLSKTYATSSCLELKFMLWDSLETLVTLVKRLVAWSRKSRSLHANGLERLFKWLQGMQKQFGFFQNEADSEMLKTSSLLLSSCWKHYGILLHLEDHRFSQQYKELLEQYLSGIQFYAGSDAEELDMSIACRMETINFFLNCLLLLLGRLDNQKFGSVIAEFGSRITQVVMSQLQCADEEIIDGAIGILKAVIFRTNHILSQCSLDDTGQMDAILPLLLNLLDEQDVAAKAVVKLVAEYCSICSNSNCLQEVLKCIDSKNVALRRNAVDVIADIIHMSSSSVRALSQASLRNVSDLLLKCLNDEDGVIKSQAANLISLIDPSFVLPALVGLSCSIHEKEQLSANMILINLLINHKEKPKILCMLLDCLSKLYRNPNLSVYPTDSKEGSDLEASGFLKLLPEWAKNVGDWNAIAGPLIDKMLAEPSNAVIVRFLSHISEYLAEMTELIFDRILLYVKGQKEIAECSSGWKGKTNACGDDMTLEHRLFSHLCPLLVIRLLPQRVFNHLSSPFLYGAFATTSDLYESIPIIVDDTESIAALLINRALSKSEFVDVRKLAAELCGRLHPNFLIPIISLQLEHASKAKDLSDIRVCLFSFCTSLMVWKSRAYEHPKVFRMKKIIHEILCWPSVDKDEISKAQHGCIDCFALMLCCELQNQQSSRLSSSENAADSALRGSVLAYVLNQLTYEKNTSVQSNKGEETSEATHMSYRLCMANVLISTCQKISGTGRKPFVKKTLPRVIRAVGEVESDISAACIQVLFSVAYHMKSLILPYSSDLLDVTQKSLRGSRKEKLAAAKLLTCLMANEEVVENVAEGLLKTRAILQSLASVDPSMDVRQMCQQLLACLTSPS